ncbi:MAG: hypothetical protein ACO1OB_07210 [Archangium sp.]
MATVAQTQQWHWPLVRALPVGLLSVALATLGSLAFPPSNWMPNDVPDVAFIEALVRWDAGWYGEIAQNGYWLKAGQQSPVAFFPLYPMIIRGIAWLGVNRWVAGIAVSFISAMTALALFHRWAQRVAPEYASAAFWLLALYPFAEYLYGVVYSDALFLLCSVGAFLALEKDKPVVSAVLGAAACACRPVAPAVVLGLLARSIERRRKAGLVLRFIDFVPALAGFGLLAFMGYLEYRFDDPLAFAHVQGVPGWEQPPGWESWLKLSFFNTMTPPVAPAVAARLGGHALMTLLALALSLPTFKRLGWGYGVYVLVVVAIPAVSSKDFQGLGRYVIAAFPLFVTLSMLLKPVPRRVVTFASAVLLVCCAVAIGAGAYVS